MGIALIIFGMLLIIGGLGGCTIAKTSIHEIASTLTATMGILLLGFGVLYERLGELRTALRYIAQHLAPPAGGGPPELRHKIKPPP